MNYAEFLTAVPVDVSTIILIAALSLIIFAALGLMWGMAVCSMDDGAGGVAGPVIVMVVTLGLWLFLTGVMARNLTRGEREDKVKANPVLMKLADEAKAMDKRLYEMMHEADKEIKYGRSEETVDGVGAKGDPGRTGDKAGDETPVGK